MVRLFDALYGRPSTLVWSGPDITSSSGVRQGDVCGPAFFCLALQPIIEATARAYPDVVVQAYMDDVALASRSTESLVAATRKLAEEAARIGLYMNNKSSAYGAAGGAVAKALEVTLCEDGMKTLGAWITDSEQSKKKIHGQALRKARSSLLRASRPRRHRDRVRNFEVLRPPEI